MGDPLPLFQNSKVVTQAPGFLFVLHGYGHPTQRRSGMGFLMGAPGKARLGARADKSYLS